MAQKKLLKKEIMQRLRSKGMKVTELAKTIGQIAESFRTRLSRNSYNRETLEKILPIVGMESDIEKLRESYEFKLTDRGVRKVAPNQDADICPLIAATSESGYKGHISIADLEFLLELQNSLQGNLSPMMIREILHMRHSPSST